MLSWCDTLSSIYNKKASITYHRAAASNKPEAEGNGLKEGWVREGGLEIHLFLISVSRWR